MAERSSQIAQELAETRQDMGDRIIELRRRSERTARRGIRIALVAAAIGVGVGAAVVTVIVVRRLSRPTTMRERVERVIPLDFGQRLGNLRARLGGRMPSVRLYLNDKALHQEDGGTKTERIAVKAAQAAGTAAAAALATKIFERMSGRAA